MTTEVLWKQHNPYLPSLQLRYVAPICYLKAMVSYVILRVVASISKGGCGTPKVDLLDSTPLTKKNKQTNILTYFVVRSGPSASYLPHPMVTGLVILLQIYISGYMLNCILCYHELISDYNFCGLVGPFILSLPPKDQTWSTAN